MYIYLSTDFQISKYDIYVFSQYVFLLSLKLHLAMIQK
jgi:hypothetical protein